MSFCARCGRPHEPDDRFCAGCGSALTPEGEQAPAAETTRADERGQTVAVEPGLAGDATMIDPPADRPDPFASWYRPETGGGADDGFMPTQTVGGGSGRPGGYPGQPQPAGYPSPGPGPGSYQTPATPVAPPFPPVPPSGGPSRGGRRGLFAVLAVVIVLAVGGGAYALATTLGARTTAPPSLGASSSAPAASPASPPAGASTSPTPAPSPALSLVAVAPGLTSVPASVQTLLSHYFHGINNHDYTEYAATLSATERARQSEQSFTAGYSTTTDSAMTLTSLASTSGGGLAATVTFTSHQAAAQSVDKSACNDWTLSLNLVPSGSGYLIGPQPSGYHPDYSDC